MPDHKTLFEEFNPVSKDQWLEKVAKDLKGKPLEDLKWQLSQAISIEPFYHADDNIGTAKISRGLIENNNWAIGEDFLVDDPANTNKKLLAALENGVDAPRFIFESIPSVETLSSLFQNIIPGYIQSHFKVTGMAPDYGLLINNFHSYLISQEIDSTELFGSFQFDAIQDEMTMALLNTSQQLFPNFKCINLNGFHLSGEPADIVPDLTAILKQVDLALQTVDATQVSQIQLSVSIGNSYFVEIAKLRAIRILWTNLLQAYGVPQIPLAIDAYINPKAFDENANTNMIRSMSIAMSAVVGGVDRLTVLPSDQQERSFSKRIARNVQHLLKMESHLNRVIDPAAGSFYVEKLTKLFAEETWAKF